MWLLCQDSEHFVKSLVDFGTKWDDKEPTEIANLLGIDNTAWSEVEPYTPVWVRDNEGNPWRRAHLIKYDSFEECPFKVTLRSKWALDRYSSVLEYKFCRLATIDEIDGVLNELQGTI